MSLISLLVTLLIVCLVIWAARSLLAAFGVGEPLSTVIYVVIVVLVVIWLVGAVGGPALPHLGLHW